MPDRIIAWTTRGKVQAGPKQIFVAAAGVFCILRGLAYVDPPPIPAGLSTLDAVMPIGWWGWAWVVAGAVALFAVWWRHYALALTPMLVLCALWGFSYTAEWAADSLLRGAESRDWITGVSYAFQAVSVLIVSRLIDPTEVKEPGDGSHDG